MSLQEPPSTSKLILRSLQPSVTSVVTSVIVATVIVFLHLLMISLSTGTIFPESNDQVLSIAYTNYLVGPLLRFFNHNVLGLITTMAIWGLTGWLLFTIAERIIGGVHEWRQVEKSTQVTPEKTIRHPLRKSYLIRVFWRAGCIAIFICLLFFVRPVLDYIMKLNGEVIAGTPTVQALIDILLSITLIVLLEHVVIVLMRLYTFRTRLTGEIIY